MQKFRTIMVTSLMATLGFPALSAAAQAATTPSFDAGLGWDSGVRFGQPETFHSLPVRMAGDTAWATSSVSAIPLAAALEPTVAQPRKVAAVPIPGSLALFASGLVMLAVSGRRRSPRRPA